MRSYLTSKITEGFWFIVVLLLGTGTLLFWNTRQLITTSAWATHSNRVLAELDDIPLQLEKAQTVSHRYILTGDEADLTLHQTIAASLQKEVEEVRFLIRDNPEQQQRLETLTPLLQERLQQLQHAIDMRRTTGFDDALKVIAEGQGEATVQRIDEVTRGMESAEEQLITTRAAAVKTRARRTLSLIIVGTLLSLFCVGVAYVILRQRLTLQRHIEEALYASEQRYRRLVESSDDGIVTLSLEGKITSTNRAFERMTGWSHEELLYQTYDKITADEAARIASARLQRAVAVERLPDTYETQLHRNDGEVIPVEVHASFLRDEGGHIIGIQELYHDISLKKALEQERANFFRMLAHDIKNPLSIILGHLEILQDKANACGATKDAAIFNQLRNNAQTILTLVTTYLVPSKPNDGNASLGLGAVSINEAVHNVVARFDEEARRRHLRLQTKCADNVSPVEGDMIALERVLANLVGNALKFTPEQGQVCVTTSQESGQVVVSVADTGPGLVLGKVTALSARRRSVEKSISETDTGLGLSIVTGLVEAHGGHVEVDSRLGTGTCISVFLPVVKNEYGRTSHAVLPASARL